MRGAALPAALLCLALAFSLGFAPRKAMLPSLAALCLGGIGALLIPWPAMMHEAGFLFCWASVILIALSVHLPPILTDKERVGLTIVFGLLAGLGSGIVVAFEGQPRDLGLAFLVALLAIPARWAVNCGLGIAIKVVASWLIAVALLVALLPLIHTPGYVPDHMS